MKRYVTMLCCAHSIFSHYERNYKGKSQLAKQIEFVCIDCLIEYGHGVESKSWHKWNGPNP